MNRHYVQLIFINGTLVSDSVFSIGTLVSDSVFSIGTLVSDSVFINGTLVSDSVFINGTLVSDSVFTNGEYKNNTKLQNLLEIGNTDYPHESMKLEILFHHQIVNRYRGLRERTVSKSQYLEFNKEKQDFDVPTNS